MANYHLRDRNLSLRAIGLMSKMLSLPEDWDYTVSGLAGICKEGREAVRTVLQELEGAGYLVRQQGRDGGQFRGNDYTLYEEPQTDPEHRCPETWATAPPLPEKPVTEKPVTDFPPQLSKELPSKDVPIPPKPPKGQRVKREKSACEYMPEMFERFWALYPRGEDKAKARYEWDVLRPDHELMRKMSAALKRQMMTDEWRRGVGVPYACRWLSNRRWEAADKLPPLPNDRAAAGEEASAWIT